MPLLLGSRTAPLAWHKVHGTRLGTTEAAEKLQEAYRYSLLAAAVYEHHVIGAVELLRSVGIEPVLVKGWAAARIYPEQALRPSGDIDLCVPPSRFEAAQSILNSPEGRRHFVDLHKGFHNLDKSSFEELFERTQLAPAGDGDKAIRVLRAEDHLRMLCLHLLRHGASLPLWLCDVAVALESRSPDFDWDLCLGSDKRRADWVACTIGLAHRLLGAYVDDTPVAWRAKHLPRWLTPAVLRTWNSLCTPRHPIMLQGPAMITYVRNRDAIGALRGLAARWPGAIDATFRTGGSFSNTPRLPYQLAECWLRLAHFVGTLPSAMKRG